MRMPVTKEYLDELREKLIDAEERCDDIDAASFRSTYRQACASAYSVGDLVWKTTKNPPENG